MALAAEFFRGHPDTPNFKPIDVQAEQKKTIAGNTAALPGLFAQAGQVNAANQEQLLAMLRKAIPGYDEIMQQIGANMNSQLKGEIPQDVADAVKRNSATNALYKGFGGSGMSNNLTARDLGLTSLGIKNQAVGSAIQWAQASKSLAVPGQFDISSNLINPTFATQFAAEERDKRFQRDYIENQWEWYDSFGQQAARFEDTTVILAGAVLGSAAGASACWVARLVFGQMNPKWILFRHWLLTKAPTWFFNAYMKHGERFSVWLKNKPILKYSIRIWMEGKIKTLEVCRG